MRQAWWWLLWLGWLAGIAPAAAEGARLERLQTGAPSAEVESLLQGQAEWEAVPENALRRQAGASWWRVSVASDPGDDRDWVLVLKEAYDAELTAYLPPDYRPQRLATFDSSLQQPGSRHRLALRLTPEARGAPVLIELGRSRGQPIRLQALPLDQYLQEDARRIRITNALLSAQLLLGLVAAIFAFALRRRMLLLFSVWVASSVLYLLVMSGELTAWFPGSSLLPRAMQLNNAAINIGIVCAYAFVMWFLDIPRHFPRIAVAVRVLLGLCVLALVVLHFDPGNVVFNTLNNLVTMALGLLALWVGMARALARSPEGWFYLLGWGCVSAAGLYRASLFVRYMGTPDWMEVAHPAINTFGALVLVLATARAARYAEREMHAAREVARLDPLTGLANRGQLDRSLDSLMQSAADTGQPLSLMFLDLDRFKAINDNHGHSVGDDCLIACAGVLREVLRSSDLLTRYGGEEFVAVLPGASQESAAAIAENLRGAIEQRCQVVAGRRLDLTVSIGQATRKTGESPAELLARADAALYRAKHLGRNRVEIAFDDVLPALA